MEVAGSACAAAVQPLEPVVWVVWVAVRLWFHKSFRSRMGDRVVRWGESGVVLREGEGESWGRDGVEQDGRVRRVGIGIGIGIGIGGKRVGGGWIGLWLGREEGKIEESEGGEEGGEGRRDGWEMFPRQKKTRWHTAWRWGGWEDVRPFPNDCCRQCHRCHHHHHRSRHWHGCCRRWHGCCLGG